MPLLEGLLQHSAPLYGLIPYSLVDLSKFRDGFILRFFRNFIVESKSLKNAVMPLQAGIGVFGGVIGAFRKVQLFCFPDQSVF